MFLTLCRILIFVSMMIATRYITYDVEADPWYMKIAKFGLFSCCLLVMTKCTPDQPLRRDGKEH